MKENNLCKCGCGGHVKKGNKYIKGHNRRGLVSFTSKGRWSMEYDCCRECGTKKRKHRREGYCTACARRLLYSGKLELKRDLTGGSWSRKYKCCKKCRTSGRPHQANGLCAVCWQEHYRRRGGVQKRIPGRWSLYYDGCLRCSTVEKVHYAKGLCYDCYEEVKREDTFGGELECCPICNVKAVRLQQHIAMKSHKCEKHLKLYNKFYDDIVAIFSTEKTSQQVSEEFNITKQRVLNVWHENFTTEEIKKRGEKIRVSKISGENNYLYGKEPPFISNNLIKFTDKKSRFYIMRSSWEVKYARYLDDSNIDWEYEGHKFKYYDIDNRPHYYFPDFYLTETSEFIEVKGHMDEKSQYKIFECIKKHGIKIKVLQRNDLIKLGIAV